MATSDNAQQIVTQIEELPPLSVVVQKLLAVTSEANSSAEDVSEVLSADQALAGKVLKLVNSSFYGFSGEISTISHAVVILGHGTIRSLALSFALSSALQKAGGPRDPVAFWNHALACAAGARTLAPYLKYRDREEAFIAGLLHDIGQYVLSVALPEEYDQVRQHAREQQLAREREVLGLSHDEVGQRLLSHWQLPENLCRVAQHHHTAEVATDAAEPLVTMVALADLIACAMGHAAAETAGPELLTGLIDRAAVPAKDFGRILKRVEARMAETSSFVQLAEIAPGEELGLAARPGSPRTIAVLGEDADRLTWVCQVLTFLGHTVVTADDYLSQAAPAPQVEMILLDLAGVAEAPLLALAERLQQQATPVVILGDTPDVKARTGPWRECPYLPYVFSPDDLDALAVPSAAVPVGG